MVVIDSLVNAISGEDNFPISLRRVEEITNKKVIFFKADVRDTAVLEKVLKLLNLVFFRYLLTSDILNIRHLGSAPFCWA